MKIKLLTLEEKVLLNKRFLIETYKGSMKEYLFN